VIDVRIPLISLYIHVQYVMLYTDTATYHTKTCWMDDACCWAAPDGFRSDRDRTVAASDL